MGISQWLTDFGRDRDAVRRPPPGFAMRADGDDAGDMLDWHGAERNETIEGLELGIVYEDQRGRITERVIECHNLVQQPGGQVVLRAHCQVRDAPRSFRLDRIRRVIDYRTGEVHDDPQAILSGFCQAVGIDWGDKAAGKDHRVFMERVRDPLKVLVYLSNSDGDVHPREADEILSYADHLALLPDGRRLDYSMDALVTWLERQRPRWRHAEQALGAMRAREFGELKDFVRALKRLIEADGMVEKQEVEAYNEIVRLLE